MTDLDALRSMLIYACREAKELKLHSTAFLIEHAISELPPETPANNGSAGQETSLHAGDTARQNEIDKPSCMERLH